MESPHTRTCPSCGAIVVLPDYCRVADGGSHSERMSQVVRAVCGCWTADLPEDATLRLLKVLANGLTERGVSHAGALEASS